MLTPISSVLCRNRFVTGRLRFLNRNIAQVDYLDALADGKLLQTQSMSGTEPNGIAMLIFEGGDLHELNFLLGANAEFLLQGGRHIVEDQAGSGRNTDCRHTGRLREIK